MKIIHINHSNLYAKAKDSILLTDPWIFKNEFGGWYQSLFQLQRIIQRILAKNNKPNIVWISHPHENHIDDELIISLGIKTKIIIPKLITKV